MNNSSLSSFISLIDMDGILIDNIAFEESVTNFIVNRMMALNSINRHRAIKLWEKSLSREKFSIKWYDYDHHCLNVGLPALSIDAHQESLDRLQPVPGAHELWNLLVKLSNEIFVVSNAPRWVTEFKLKAMGFSGYANLLSSQDFGKEKSQPAFWLKLKEVLPISPIIYIDNRIQNLICALDWMDQLTCIHFNRMEHSMTLPDSIRPFDFGELSDSLVVHVANDHLELCSQINKIVTGQ